MTNYERPPDLEPTFAEVAYLLQWLVEGSLPTDADREALAEHLLGLGTRSQWRDAFFFADLDGEDPPEDRCPVAISAQDPSAADLQMLLKEYSLAHRPDHAGLRAFARVLLGMASEAEWHMAFRRETGGMAS
jgi:hypothetical protein